MLSGASPTTSAVPRRSIRIGTLTLVGDAVFRAGTVAVVWRGTEEILAFERVSPRGAWQLPQGGLHRGESVIDGVWRELREETGLGPTDVELRSEHPDWMIYEIPVELRRDHRLGQAQRWFHFEVIDPSTEPRPDQREFISWAWLSPVDLIAGVVDFKRAVYQTVLGRGRPF